MRWGRGAPVYAAIDAFRRDALERDGSLFTPSPAVWTAATIEDLHRRYNMQPDTSSASFDVKLQRQLSGAPDATIHLAAEAIYIHQLIVDDIGRKSKCKLLDTVLAWIYGQELEQAMPSWRARRDELNQAPLGHEDWTY